MSFAFSACLEEEKKKLGFERLEDPLLGCVFHCFVGWLVKLTAGFVSHYERRSPIGLIPKDRL